MTHGFEELLSLHRYFVWAGEMQTQLLKIFTRAKEQRTVQTVRRIMRALGGGTWNISRKQMKTFLYLSYWYGALYVVVEGWKSLDLHDEVVDHLLDSPNVALLKLYRNAVFHYRRGYYDNKFIAFIRDGRDAALWVASLHEAIGNAILARLRATQEADHSGKLGQG